MMKIASNLDELRRARSAISGTLGLVPTMGGLHTGHLSLVQTAREQNDCVAASIFVNPLQFGMGEDLDDYPRDPDGDLEKLESKGVDLVWMPDKTEIYPHGYQTYVTVEQLASRLEGERRPGHMRGVTTMVTKLLIAFTPDRVYLGQKDAQQVYVIQRLVADLQFAVDVVVCPTVRDLDGLALSSRNAILNPDQLAAATVLYRALCAARSVFMEGERSGSRLRGVMTEIVAAEPLAEPLYVSIADIETLEELPQLPQKSLCSLAVRIGKVALIDNIVLEIT